MTHLTVLPVAIPLLVAAILMGGQPILHRRFIDAAGDRDRGGRACVLCWLLAWGAATGSDHHLGRGLAAAGGRGAGRRLRRGSRSGRAWPASRPRWRRPRWSSPGATSRPSRALYHALMLVFLAGMTGFCLTGDLFNMFVFFELMSVAAYALTGYKIEEEKSLEGALNFAVVNSVGRLPDPDRDRPALRPDRAL